MDYAGHRLFFGGYDSLRSFYVDSYDTRSHFVFLRDCHGRWFGSGLVNLSRFRLFIHLSCDMEQSMLRLVVFEVGTDCKSSTIALGWLTESCLFWPTDGWAEARHVCRRVPITKELQDICQVPGSH